MKLNRVAIIYVAVSLIRIVLSFRYVGPGIMSDELLYKTYAESFFSFGDFYRLKTRGVATNMPNVLYQYLISFSFYFGRDFFTAIKAMNALLIGTVIFPTYLIARSFCSERGALLAGTLVMLLPSNLYANYVLPESLFFPLYMFSFYFILKCLTGNKILDAAASGVCVTLLFLTKPHAVTLVLAMIPVVIILMVFARRFSVHRGMLSRSVALTIVSMVTSYVILTLLIKHRFDLSNVFGHYGGAGWDLLTEPPKLAIHPEESLRMVAAHLTGFLFPYGIPAIVVLAALVRSFKAKDLQAFTFLLWGIALFLAFFVMTMKFTVYLGTHDIKQLVRLHGRYYFFVYPFFIVAFIAFVKEMDRSILNAVTLIVTGALVGTSLMFVFPAFRRSTLLADWPEWVWLITPNTGRMLTALIVAFLFLCVYYAFSRARRHYPYVIFLVVFLTIGNVGALSVQTGHARNQWNAIKNSLALIESTIVNRRDPIMLIGFWSPMRMQLTFWLPYGSVYVSVLPPGFQISDRMIPGGTKWLILMERYTVTAPLRLVRSDGLITIHSLD